MEKVFPAKITGFLKNCYIRIGRVEIGSKATEIVPMYRSYVVTSSSSIQWYNCGIGFCIAMYEPVYLHADNQEQPPSDFC